MKLNETNSNYAVVKTAFHGGGILSYHKSPKAAERAASKYRNNDCECGCCSVVSVSELENIPDYTGNERSPYILCK